MTNFLTGIDFSYWLTPEQEFRFQVVDSRNGSFEELYGEVPDVKQAKAPLGYTLNWNGNFWEERLKTRWSASIFHEAKKKTGITTLWEQSFQLPNSSDFSTLCIPMKI